MMSDNNPSRFKKGEKKINQGKRGPSKTTVQAREAIATFVELNTSRMQEWLDAVAEDDRHGPYVAFKMVTEIMEYHLPKLARTEHVGDKGGAIQVNITQLDELL